MPDPRIGRFALLMETRLAQAPSGLPVDALTTRLHEEMAQVAAAAAFFQNPNPTVPQELELDQQCADLANIAMLITEASHGVVPPPPPPPPPPQFPAFQQKLLTTQPNPEQTNNWLLANNVEFVRFHGYNAGVGNVQAQALKRLRPEVTILYYRLPFGTWTWQENWSEINRHEDWFAHAANGARIGRSAVGNDFFYNDLGNPAFREYQRNYIMAAINRFGYDGFWSDGPPPTLKSSWPTPGFPQSYVEGWHPNVVRWLAEMKAALGTKLHITNSTFYGFDYIGPRTFFRNPDPDWADDYFLPHVDGTMIEGAYHAQWHPYATFRPDYWTITQARYQRNLDAGKAVQILSGTLSPGSVPGSEMQRLRVFTYASYLLKADGTRTSYQWGVYRGTEFPELNLDIGAATGSARLDAAGNWRRDFTRGHVVVNPTTAPRGGLAPVSATIAVI